MVFTYIKVSFYGSTQAIKLFTFVSLLIAEHGEFLRDPYLDKGVDLRSHEYGLN